MKKCVVIGSINMDIVSSVTRFPQPGETLTGLDFQTVPGGKGANQAVALARLGADVRMVGKVGDDAFGKRYLEHFAANGVKTDTVGIDPTQPTGIANIVVDASGENFIVLVPGANGTCDEVWLDGVLEHVMDCDIFLLQLEIPLKTVEKAIKTLRAADKMIILDPAPAVELPDEILRMVDYITPNETELEIITAALGSDADMETRIHHLIGDSRRTVIHKRGADGAYIATRDGIRHIPGYTVPVVDTTAAGDTFNAGVAMGLAQGLPIDEAVRLGNAAGALAVTAFGAQDGMPTMEKALELVENHGA